MRANRTDVVVTGLGAQSPAGEGTKALFDALASGRSSLAFDDEMSERGLGCRVSGRMPWIERSFAEARGLDTKERAYFGRFSQLGWLAATEALIDARIVGDDISRSAAATTRGQVAVGTGIGAIGELGLQFRALFERGRPRSPGHAVPHVMPSFFPTFLAARLGAELGGFALSLACNGGLVALEQGYHAIRSGRADWALVGGVEEDAIGTFWSFDSMRALARTSTTSGDPSAASRPFGRGVRGFVPSGSAAFALLESRAHAERRGAPIRATVRSARHRAAPGAALSVFDPAGYASVVDAALVEAELSASDVDLVVPHAISSAADGGEIEALAMALDLGHGKTRVHAPKALLGHSLAGSGVLDFAVLVAQLERRQLFGNPRADDLCDAARPFASALAYGPSFAPLRVGLKCGYAFGGSNAAVVVEAEGN